MFLLIFLVRDASVSRRRLDKRQRRSVSGLDDTDDSSSRTGSVPSGVSIEFPPAVDDDDDDRHEGTLDFTLIVYDVISLLVHNNAIGRIKPGLLIKKMFLQKLEALTLRLAVASDLRYQPQERVKRSSLFM